jgi:DNA invertase Pin-like site-specific DNA recombinase
VSGSLQRRPQWDRCLKALESGDVLIVWRLDRAGRSLQHLITVVEDLRGRGVQFRSLHESLDTTSANGRLIFHIMAALAEFERDLIRERTVAGLKAARKRGVHLGRKFLLNQPQVEHVRQLVVEEGRRVIEAAKLMGVSYATIYRYLARTRAARQRSE